MELKGSQTQTMKCSNRTRKSKAHTNQSNPALSLLVIKKVWRRHQAMLSSREQDSTICIQLDTLSI